MRLEIAANQRLAHSRGNRGRIPGGWGSGWPGLTADEVWKVRDERSAGEFEPGAEVVPEGDAELPAGLGQTKEGVAAVAAAVAVGATADLTLGHLTADVVFRAVGVQGGFR